IRDLTVTGVQTCALPICVKDVHLGDAEAACYLQPSQEGLRLLRAPRRNEGTRTDASISGPGITVVPVELAAQLFGQRHCRSCHRSEERRVGKECRCVVLE